MTRRLTVGRLTAGLAAGALLVTGCDSDRRAIDRSDLPDFDPTPAVVVAIDEGGFDPDAVEIVAGTPIEFTVVADGPRGAVASDDRFTTGALLDGESTLVVLDTPGEVVVEELTDPANTMTVVVVEAEDQSS